MCEMERQSRKDTRMVELVDNGSGSRRVEETSEDASSYQAMSMMMLTSIIPH